jgi:hypothetical protein
MCLPNNSLCLTKILLFQKRSKSVSSARLYPNCLILYIVQRKLGVIFFFSRKEAKALALRGYIRIVLCSTSYNETMGGILLFQKRSKSVSSARLNWNTIKKYIIQYFRRTHAVIEKGHFTVESCIMYLVMVFEFRW